MVSFQCDGCSDVVKKSKLDQHRSRCNASFTCIDCSTTFAGPAQYKGHTSCISEAEKYQKSLYKGSKSNGQNASGPRGNHQNTNSSANQNGYNVAANGKYPHPRQQRPPSYARYSATGANDTPLGTPVRMSPVDPSPPPRLPGAASSSLPASASTAKAETNGNTNGKGKGKRKAEDSAEVVTEPKKKKSKKENGADAQPSTSAADTEASSPSTEKKEEKKHKKKTAVVEKDGTEVAAPALSTDGTKEKKKAKKEKKAKADAVPTTNGEGAETADKADDHTESEPKENKAKSRKGDKATAEGEASVAEVETKLKKRKRDSEAAEKDGTGAQGGDSREKKSKKKVGKDYLENGAKTARKEKRAWAVEAKIP